MTATRPSSSSSPSGLATACACANIALVKYWGKRDARLNLPAQGSLSLTLAELTTTTTVHFSEALDSDALYLSGQLVAGKEVLRMSQWLDLVREAAGITHRALVRSANSFPTASGLASSASAYAALAVAASAAAGLALSPTELSILARRGSGSAARSIFGGFVRMHRGERDDGTDCVAAPLGADDWPVRMVIAIVGGGKVKEHSSRDAMDHCAETSPLYAGFLAAVPRDLMAAEEAISRRDLEALGQIAEASALAMHGAAMASRPATIYFEPATLACMARVRELRRSGTLAYYTMDAGPHVKVLTDAGSAAAVAGALRELPGVSEVLVSAPGGGTVLVADAAPVEAT